MDTAPGSRKRSVFEANTITVFGRIGGAPSESASDDFSAAFAPSIVIPAPQPGVWVIAVKKSGADASEYKLTASWKVCVNDTVGPDCTATFAPVIMANGTSTTGSTPANGFAYYRVAPTNGKDIYVSLGALNGSQSQVSFTLFIGVNGLPTQNAYAYKGCNTGPCKVVQAVKISGSADNQVYYIGVYGNSSAESFALWANAQCADACTARGTCQTSDDANYGVCKCDNGYIDINCAGSQTGLPIQVIVLIIIGGLLLLTALIGLIAWIVSRRKRREGYETVA
jgi:hypothetical protein